MNKQFFTILCLFVCILLGATSAKAQFSLMLGGNYISQGSKSGSQPLLGLGGKFGVDLGKKSEVNFNLEHYNSVEWRYKKDMEFMNKFFSFHYPASYNGPVNLTVNKFSLTYSYFFWGDNAGPGGMYAAAGPALVKYSADITTLDAKQHEEHIAQKAATAYLDTRLGAQVHIGIGWLYAEGVMYPHIAQLGDASYLPDTHFYYGMNMGIRFLLNKHPNCPIE